VRDRTGLRILFSEQEIRARVESLALEIAQQTDPPDLALPILTGAFMFAADLLRALDMHGLSLPVEFLRLRSYGEERSAQGEVCVLAHPGELVRGHHVLLIDGVLDGGHTLAKGRDLALAAGARRISTAVAVDKRRNGALLSADFAGFVDVEDFIVGYGMDDAGRLRSLPHIAAAS
jgi:hypoxanthine phosphoribosyltransferase